MRGTAVFLCCLHFAEKQLASNLRLQGPAPNAPRLRANQPTLTAIASREEFPGTRTQPMPGARAVARVGPLAVLRGQISAPGSRAPQGAPHQKLENTHHKREGERLPACEESPALAGPLLPGEASAAAAHSGAPERP